MRILILAALALAGCGLLPEVPGGPDQPTVENSRPAIAAEYALPPLAIGSAELGKDLQEIGRAIARRARPWSQLELTVASNREAAFILGQVEHGVRSTGWEPEALLYPPVVLYSLDTGPTLRVVHGLPSLSDYDRRKMVENSRRAQQLR